MVTVASSQPEGLGVELFCGVCVLLCSHVGFLLLLWFPPTHVRLIDVSKLTLRLSVNAVYNHVEMHGN